jgi:hypothetical protein
MPLTKQEIEELRLKRLFVKMNSGSQDPRVMRKVEEARIEVKKLENKEES